MVEETPRGGNQEIDTFAKLICFAAPVRTTHDDAGCLRVMLKKLSRNRPDLEGKFAGWGYADGSSAISSCVRLLVVEAQEQVKGALVGTNA